MSPLTSTRPFDRGGITPGPVRKKGKEQEVPYQWVHHTVLNSAQYNMY